MFYFLKKNAGNREENQSVPTECGAWITPQFFVSQRKAAGDPDGFARIFPADGGKDASDRRAGH